MFLDEYIPDWKRAKQDTTNSRFTGDGSGKYDRRGTSLAAEPRTG